MRKITAGFKCDPELKSELISEANESGISLSEYLESLCENRKKEIVRTRFIERPVNSEELEELQNRIYEYEEVLLGDLFEKHRDTEVTVKLPNRPDIKRFISEPQDLIKVFLETINPES